MNLPPGDHHSALIRQTYKPVTSIRNIRTLADIKTIEGVTGTSPDMSLAGKMNSKFDCEEHTNVEESHTNMRCKEVLETRRIY
jgi:hypothetical protein